MPLNIQTILMQAIPAQYRWKCLLFEKWKQIIGVGLLAGIGFTMSIFITLLAFDNPGLITQSKIAILIASVVAGTLGYLWLRATLKPQTTETENGD